MALIPASLNLTFTSNYVGCHRICWRPVGAPTYNCTTEVTCGGNGASCSAVIGIQVDDASCIPVSFEGYAQACCETVGSPNGQLPFLLTFTPNTNCQGYSITCIGPVTVQSVSIVNPGSGYIPAAVIPVVFAGGGCGTPPVGDAIVGNGGISALVNSITPFPFGSGYTDGFYVNVPMLTTSGAGIGGLFDVTVSGGQVVQIDVVPGSNGTGYAAFDTITFNDALIGGGTGAVANVNTLNTGEIQFVNITVPGVGCTSPVTASIPPPVSGVQASLGVIMGLCQPLDLTTCGGLGDPIQGVPLGESFIACFTSAPTLPVDYSVVQDACCNQCTTIQFDKPFDYTNPPARIYYTDCATQQIVQVVITAGGTVGPVCAVNGSWFVEESDPFTGSTSISVAGACTTP